MKIKYFYSTVLILILLCGCSSGHVNRINKNRIFCCEGYGINLNPILDENTTDCGFINTWPFPKSKNLARIRAKDSSIACAKNSEMKGIPFIVGQSWAAPPDGGGTKYAFFSSTGTKILISQGDLGDERWFFVGTCRNIEFTTEGEIQTNDDDCQFDAALYERIKIKK